MNQDLPRTKTVANSSEASPFGYAAGAFKPAFPTSGCGELVRGERPTDDVAILLSERHDREGHLKPSNPADELNRKAHE